MYIHNECTAIDIHNVCTNVQLRTLPIIHVELYHNRPPYHFTLREQSSFTTMLLGFKSCNCIHMYMYTHMYQMILYKTQAKSLLRYVHVYAWELLHTHIYTCIHVHIHVYTCTLYVKYIVCKVHVACALYIVNRITSTHSVDDACYVEMLYIWTPSNNVT